MHVRPSGPHSGSEPLAWHRIVLSAPLCSGDKQVCQVAEREVLVSRVEDRYFATSSRCTHAAWPLVGEPILGMEIVCTLHGARFDLRDGCPSSGPAHKPLDTYAIEQRDGDLFVNLPDPSVPAQ